MNLIMYNINSFGGNYAYANALYKAYKQNGFFENCILIMPSNAAVHGDHIYKFLLADLINISGKALKKLYFLYRSFINPVRFFLYILKQPKSIVLFNDFDQVTAFFWVPLFKCIQAKHLYAVILHDPDRDDFFPVKSLSEISMQWIMSFMDIAFYHGYLPDKKYYKNNSVKVCIPHGIYTRGVSDNSFLDKIKAQVNGDFIVGILGNIRDEKNYEVVMDAVSTLEGIQILIAGKPASSGVDIGHYQRYADKLHMQHKIIWEIQYLNNESFNAAIEVCDVILLLYKPSFTSQSGMLNSIAPFKKKLIISDVQSSLKEAVIKHNIGAVVPHNNPAELAKAITRQLLFENYHLESNWDKYILESSWQRHVEIAMDSYKKLLD